MAEIKSKNKELEESFQSQIKQLEQELEKERAIISNLTDKLESTQQELSHLKDTGNSVKKNKCRRIHKKP